MRWSVFRRSIGSLGAIALILFAYGMARANQCTTPTVCQAYTQAEAVFVGKLVKLEPDKESSPVFYAHFEVETTYKGKTEKIEIVPFFVGSPERKFIVGEKHFVYKQPLSPKMVCNLTDTLSNSVSDLEYVRKLSQSKPTFTIMGWIGRLSESERRRATVVVETERDGFEVPIDNNGNYNFAAEKEGTYHVKVSLPFEATMFVENLGEFEKVIGSVFEYSVRFQANECDYRSIEVSRNSDLYSLFGARRRLFGVGFP